MTTCFSSSDLSVVLDPSFPTAIYARLLEGEDGEHTLIWSRTKSE